MSKKIVDSIRRTGKATSAIRHIEVVQGSGKTKVREVLSTPIIKVTGPELFQGGPARIPVEQYGFKVGAKHVERFADAAALVLRKHQVKLAQPKGDDVQVYVKKAFAIIDGEAELRTFTPPDSFHPAGPTS